MKGLRGDIVLAWYPFASGAGSKRRPCLIIQNDDGNRRLQNTIVAQITSNLRRRGEPSHVFIAADSLEDKSAGILHDSLISCNNLATIETALIERKIGHLAPAVQLLVDQSVRNALNLIDPIAASNSS